MRPFRHILLLALVNHWLGGVAASADLEHGPIGRAEVQQAVKHAIPLLERGSAGSADVRECFTCHSQALPVIALSEALGHGFSVDRENLLRQLLHTAEHLRRGQENYTAGKGQGGQVLTAGYALWSLAAGNWQPTESTAAVTHYLLHHQREDDHWHRKSKRPPTSGSPFTNTYVALRGLRVFGTEKQQQEIVARTVQVTEWLRQSEPIDTEDHVFRLLALRLIDDAALVEQQASALMATQRTDGGWAQLTEMESDAYATATALYALLATRQLSPTDAPAKRGIAYLLRAQEVDGSWHVVTRADGFQTYFESGFPHGEDQFLSIAASSWATLALLQALP